MKLNIYQFNYQGAKDWVIAKSKKNAIDIHHSISDVDLSEYNDEIKVFFVKKKDWDKYTYFEDSEENKITFRKYMETKAVREDFFCSTEY